MIEFTADGPFAGGKADPLFPDRVRIIGLGQTGAAVCDQLVLHGRPGQDVWVFDTDQQTIEASVVPNRHLLGEATVHGLGCSGDLDLAREIVRQDVAKLAATMHGCDFVILVVALGSSTGLALAEHLAQLGRHSGAKVIAIGVQPFSFEGLAKRERSITAIATLRAECDSVLVLAHDRLDANPNAPRNIRHSFHLMHQLMAQAVQALAQVVCKRGLIQLSFADVRSLYGRYQGAEALENCWVAHVEGDIHDTTGDLIGRLFNSPLIADEAVWKLIDHAIVAVSGTRDLGLSDVQEMVGAFQQRLETDIAIATSASLDDEHHDRVRMTVLLAMTTPIPVDSRPPAEPVKNSPPEPRVLGDTVALPALGVKKKAAASATETSLAEKPAAKPVRTKYVSPKPRPPEPEIIPAIAIVGETSEEIAEEIAGEIPIIRPAPLPDEEPDDAPAARRSETRQEEMQFEATRGRFEKTAETIYRGENLDQPTYRRRRLAIRL
jgi:cell division protein FtsZ